MNTLVQTSFVPGWAVGVPLLILAAVLLWAVLSDEPEAKVHEGLDPDCRYWLGMIEYGKEHRCKICNPKEEDDGDRNGA